MIKTNEFTFQDPSTLDNPNIDQIVECILLCEKGDMDFFDRYSDLSNDDKIYTMMTMVDTYIPRHLDISKSPLTSLLTKINEREFRDDKSFKHLRKDFFRCLILVNPESLEDYPEFKEEYNQNMPLGYDQRKSIAIFDDNIDLIIKQLV